MKSPKGKKINVLVVEDSETSGILLKSILEEQNKYDVQVVNSGKKAISFDKSNINLILLDLMMPDIDGIEVLKRLKADDKTKNIPVIIVSARNNKTDMKLAKSLGADSYLLKPIDEIALFEQIELINK